MKIICYTSSFRTALVWLSQQPVILFTHKISIIWSIISKIVGYGWDVYYGRGRKVDSAASDKNLFQTQQDFLLAAAMSGLARSTSTDIHILQMTFLAYKFKMFPKSRWDAPHFWKRKARRADTSRQKNNNAFHSFHVLV